MTAWVVSAGAASAAGFDWRTLGGTGAGAAGAPVGAGAAGHRAEVPAIPPELDVGDARLHRVMSRPARLLAVAAHQALGEAAWGALDAVGYYVGAGFQPVPPAELEAVLAASWDGGLSLDRLGRKGLRAFHPLRTFLLLSNFTMCHSALYEATRGPSAVLFSRGGGTVGALEAALAALAEGDCARALVGGADSPFDVMEAADQRAALAQGMRLGEGAAVLALAREPGARPLARIAGTRLVSARKSGLAAAAARAAAVAVDAPDLVVLSPWGPPARAVLEALAAERWPGATLVDVSEALGESFAAAPALAWSAALAALVAGRARRALVLSAGVDTQVGAVVVEAA